MCCTAYFPQEAWWKVVRLDDYVRVFPSKEAAEHFIAQDPAKLHGKDLEVWRKLNFQKDQAVGH